LSFGSETGRTRSGTKGFSNKTKKLKRKKQEFHSHRRAHLEEAQQLDPEQVRARTTLALDRLGHQVISTEPGGYDLEDWTRNLNSLLDDFEEKVGADRITDEFHQRRHAALLTLVQPSASHDVDAEIERLIKEEAAVKEALAELARKSAAKLATLRAERDACEKELKLAKENLAELREAKQSRPFFSRLVGSGPSTDQAEAKVAELEAKLSRLGDEIDSHRRARSAPVKSAPADGGSVNPNLEAEQKLETIQRRLDELKSAKQGMLQLSHEREIATKAISEMLSSMNLGPSGIKDGSQVE
jgi:DNA repair exonuclease SbcCD ATPase subunit